MQLYSELCSVQSLNTDIMFLAEQFQISFLANHVAHFCIQTRPLRDPGIVENKIPVFVGILVKYTRQCFQRLGFQTTLFSLQGTQSAKNVYSADPGSIFACRSKDFPAVRKYTRICFSIDICQLSFTFHLIPTHNHELKIKKP